MADESDGSSTKKVHNLQALAGALAGDLLMKAVSVGAGAYVSAEDKVNKTLDAVQMPITMSKAMAKELLESFLEGYSIDIKATINFTPKKKGEFEK